jgi:hypothetical protein
VDYGGTLRRAWRTVWDYKALWLFGAILALTAADGGSRGSEFLGADYDNFRYELGPWPQGVPEKWIPTLIGVAIGLAVLFVLYGIVAAFGRYVAETSLIGMVDAYEESGAKKTVRQGFRMGWSRSAWRLFLIDLLVGVPVFLIIVAVFAAVAGPAFLWLTGNDVAGAIGTAATVLLAIPAIGLVIVVGVVLSVLMRFFRRACVIEGLGVRASIRRGFAVARRGLGNVAVVWLIMLGVGVGWAIASIILFFVLLPLFILTIAIGAVLGGLPPLIAYGIASLAAGGPAGWIQYIAAGGVGLGIGLPVFVLIAFSPWIFVQGLAQVFTSSVWTQVYRDLSAREEAAEALPAPDAVAPESAEEDPQ